MNFIKKHCKKIYILFYKKCYIKIKLYSIDILKENIVVHSGGLIDFFEFCDRNLLEFEKYENDYIELK